MKKKLTLISLALILTMLGSMFSINLGVFANTVDNSITYITDNDDSGKIIDTAKLNSDEVASTEVKHVKINDIKKLNNSSKPNIWVDGKLLDNPNLKEQLKQLYDDGCKIVVRKDGITQKEIIDYFGLNIGYTIGEKSPNSILKPVAVMINKASDGGFDTNLISVENYAIEEENERGMLFATKSKFIDRVRGKFKGNGLLSLFTMNTAYAAFSEWTPVATDSRTDYYVNCTVQTTNSLQKESQQSTKR